MSVAVFIPSKLLKQCIMNFCILCPMNNKHLKPVTFCIFYYDFQLLILLLYLYRKNLLRLTVLLQEQFVYTRNNTEYLLIQNLNGATLKV